MNFKHTILVVFSSAILLTSLFYKQYFGLNILFFDLAFLFWLTITKQLRWQHRNEIVTAGGFLLAAIFTVVTHSVFSYFMHFVAMFVFVGVLNYTKVKSLVLALGISILALIHSQSKFMNRLTSSRLNGKKLGVIFWKSRIFVIPLGVIFLFITIYSFSNPVFGDMVSNIGLGIQNVFTFLFADLDFALIFTFLFSLFISIFLLVRITFKGLVQQDNDATEDLKRSRKRQNRRFRLTALKNEYKAGIFLLLILNALLLILNVLDVYWVWFNFAWEGQTLKQFVHEGTYLLIFSIMISIAVVLFFFRGNLNFYVKNKFLKYLGYIWIVQNGVLAISVSIRNFRYIEYFSLAYKRIGVIIFLLLVLYGLYTVFRKIRYKKSTFYLFKANALALYLVLIFASFVNWDSLIAKYNFDHAQNSYLHLAYMATLSDKSLPELDKPFPQLSEITSFQSRKFDFNHPMTPQQYHGIIENRKRKFKVKWESRNILSWNLSEYLAYKKLFNP